MTIEDFEETIESFKREYLTIVKKIGPDHIWMAPHKNDWYHSQYFVIDVKRNIDSELELSLNVNDLNIPDKILANRLSGLKLFIEEENFKFESIVDAKNKFHEITNNNSYVLENKRAEYVYSENSKINNIEDKLSGFTALSSLSNSNNSKNIAEINEKETFEIDNIYGDLFLTDEVKASFYNGLKSKGFVILAGISGIGKTKIFENFVRNFKEDSHIFVPIRPDFRDSKSLLGFYNPLSEEYQTTKLLELIIKASNDVKNPYFVLFDEMNLARVEYYFADFLSVLESKRDLKGFTTQYIQLHNSDKKNISTKSSSNKKNKNINIPKEINLPPNLYFVGSVNIDETTYMFSPKILDRAFTIEFKIDSFEKYANFLKEKKKVNIPISSDFSKELIEDFLNHESYTEIIKDNDFIDYANQYFLDLEYINSILPSNLQFGYRVFDEIILFILNSENSIFEFKNNQEAFDIAIKMKILPKFHGTRDKLERIFDDLLEFTENNKLFHTTAKIKSMQNNLNNMGYTSFM